MDYGRVGLRRHLRRRYLRLGLSALILYPSAYLALAALQVLSEWLKWPLMNLFHSLIWLCLAAFAGTMTYVLMVLDPFWS